MITPGSMITCHFLLLLFVLYTHCQKEIPEDYYYYRNDANEEGPRRAQKVSPLGTGSKRNDTTHWVVMDVCPFHQHVGQPERTFAAMGAVSAGIILRCTKHEHQFDSARSRSSAPATASRQISVVSVSCAARSGSTVHDHTELLHSPRSLGAPSRPAHETIDVDTTATGKVLG